MWLVQRPLGPVLANHPAYSHGRARRRRRRGKARLLSHDDNEEDRCRHHRCRTPRVATDEEVPRSPAATEVEGAARLAAEPYSYYGRLMATRRTIETTKVSIAITHDDLLVFRARAKRLH